MPLAGFPWLVMLGFVEGCVEHPQVLVSEVQAGIATRWMGELYSPSASRFSPEGHMIRRSAPISATTR